MKLFPRGFRLPRYEILIVAGVALLAFIITLSVMASSVGARARRRAQQEQQQPRTQPILSAEDLALTPDDFILPQAPSMSTDIPYVPFRPRLEQWSAEIAGKYWISPRDIAIDVLRSVNDENMKMLLQDVP